MRFFIFYRNWHDFSVISIENYFDLLGAVILSFLILLMNGVLNKVLINKFGIDLSFREWFGLSVVSTLGNILTPFRGGLALNAMYLNKKYSFRYSKYAALTSGAYVIIFWINSILGLLACWYIKCAYGILNWYVFGVFLMFALFLSLIIFLKPKFKGFKNSYTSKYLDALNDWQLVCDQKNVFIKLILINMITIVILIFINYFEFAAFGAHINLIKLLFISVFGTFSLLISITPANFGFKEAFTIFSGVIIGLAIPQIIIVSVLDRLINFGLSFVFGVPFSLYLQRKLTI